jgi:hypothetical protein
VGGLYPAQENEEHRFFSLASKRRSTVSPGLPSKFVASGFLVWTQNRYLQFGNLGLKIIATIY